MLSFHVKFMQTDRQTDNGKTICPTISIQGRKKAKLLVTSNFALSNNVFLPIWHLFFILSTL